MFDTLFLIGLAVILALMVWLRKKRVDPYDLKRLFDDPAVDPGDEHDGMVTAESGPYCHSCDHPNPAGARVCLSCGRPL